MDPIIKDAEFTISKSLIIRYKRGFGFWILKEIDNQWLSYTREFSCNPLAIGFKTQYGFTYHDLKEFFFKTFDEAVSMMDKVDDLPYWEYNKKTHGKFGDTIMRPHQFERSLMKIFVETVKMDEKVARQIVNNIKNG